MAHYSRAQPRVRFENGLSSREALSGPISGPGLQRACDSEVDWQTCDRAPRKCPLPVGGALVQLLAPPAAMVATLPSFTCIRHVENLPAHNRAASHCRH